MTNLTFMDFVEHADAVLKKGLLIRKEPIPPLSQSHLFHLGDDEKISDTAYELRDDLAKDITHRVPFPFADTTMISSIAGTGWMLDRVFDLGYAQFKVPVSAYLDTSDPGITEEKRKALLKEMLHRNKAHFFDIVRIEEGIKFPVMWTVAYYGAVASAFCFIALNETEFVYGHEVASKDPGYANLQELTRTNVAAIIRQTALISHPSNYYVKVEPRLTPREERRTQRGEPRPIRKAPHFIIVDHEQLCDLNRTHGGTHASPVPHHRRGHWRRVAERFINAKLKGERMWVRPAYVGQTRFEDTKAIYNVLMDWKKPE